MSKANLPSSVVTSNSGISSPLATAAGSNIVNLPTFQASTAYPAGFVIQQSSVLYARNSSGTSGVSWAADSSNWTQVADAAGSAATAQSNAEAASLPLSGGTMSGVITMGSHKVTGLANGSVSTDAVAYGQLGSAAFDTGPAGTIIGTTDTQTISNKRITRRVVSVTQSATPAIDTDNVDVAAITGLAQGITSMTTNLTGTPVAGDSLIVQITDNGTAQTISWGSSFEASTVALPTTTVTSTMLMTGFIWNIATSKWRCIAVA